MGSSKYIKGVMINVERTLKEKVKLSFPKNAPNPFPLNYRLEIVTSPELQPDEVKYFQALIGITIWLA